jgi:hypothetical protein
LNSGVSEITALGNSDAFSEPSPSTRRASACPCRGDPELVDVLWSPLTDLLPDRCTPSVALSGLGVKSEDAGVGLTSPVALDHMLNCVSLLAELTPVELGNIEHNPLGLRTEKYDEFVPLTLLQQFWGRRNAGATPTIAREALASAGR